MIFQPRFVVANANLFTFAFRHNLVFLHEPLGGLRERFFRRRCAAGLLCAQLQIPVLSDFLCPRQAVTIQSRWPIVDQLKTAAASNEIRFDPFADKIPDLLEASFDVKIKESWFRTDVEFLPNDMTPLLSSETISVAFFKSGNGKEPIVWIFEQTDKRDNTQRLAVTDEPKFHGSAVLTVYEGATELQGQYWQNGSWDRGLNAADLIVLRRKAK